MAWIESHQDLRTNPKTRRAARALEITPVHLIGHLHALWWWALDHAEDGNISAFDAEDLADAAEWDGDAGRFFKALHGCGPGEKAGFIEHDGLYGNPEDGARAPVVLHDWWEYAGKLVERRRSDRERKRRARRAPPDGLPGDIRPTSAGRPPDVPTESVRTEQNPTEPLSTPSSDSAEPDGGAGYECTNASCRCEDADVRALTTFVARAIEENGHKLPLKNTKARHDWRAAIDKLERIDGVAPAEIRRVAEWATRDEFWQANIQSTLKLREKYPQLRLRAMNPSGRRERGARHVPPGQRKQATDPITGKPIPGVYESETW
jgi:hypothetical protein